MTDMTGTTPTRILVVEDEMIISKDIQRSLRRLGYEVVGAAASGADALEKAQSTRPDLVLMDIHIQGAMDGIDTAQQIRERLAIPVIYLTAFADGPTLERAKLTEPYGYLIKPFEERELSVTIEMGLSKHSMEQRLQASEEKFRRLVEQAADALFTHDREGRLLDVNRAACESLGYSREELLQMTVMDIEVGVAHPQLDFMWQQMTPDAPLTANGRHRRKDSTTFPVEVRVGFIEAEGQQVMLALVRDVTERERVQHSLREAQATLLETNTSLERRVDERTTALLQSNAALQHAKEEAETANRAKSEFLSRISHELRTPMNAILGFGQILEMQELSPRQSESIGHILKGGRHLLDLINEVLDITRFEAGHLELSLEPVALDDEVSDACALVRPLAAERKIRLQENLAQLNGHYVLADRQRLKQVLINLLSNAIKYNHEGGQVEVSCTHQPDGSNSLSVRDTGPGISPEDLPKLFTPFERLNASSTAIEGTGLGLALSQGMVTAMGGTLSVKSILGQGSIFTIELPQATAPEERATNVPKETHSLHADKQSEQLYSVLCIEDNPSNLRLMETLFDMRPDTTLLAAVQGSIGLDLARQHEPDLILLDLDLPDIHGSEVLTRLQGSPLTRDIPVVVISADATPAQIERLLAAGAKGYLAKPLDVVQFFKTVDTFLLPGQP